MYDDYQLRKDINRVITFLNNLEKIEDDDSILALLKEELGKYYDSSEVDVVTGKLNDDLTELHSSLGDLTDGLIEFNGELIAFDESNTNLKGDLSKLKQNLQKFTAAVNKLKVDLKGLDEKSDEFDEDLWGEGGLDERLTSLGVKIGNDDSGLVKGLNDLTDGLDQLEDDVFGTNGLSSQLSALEGTINNPTTGLAAQLTGLDSRVFGANGLSESIFGANGLASRIGAAEGGLSNLTDSLDTLVEFLTNFEGTLDDFEEALEEDSNIDTSELNSSITALLGLIAGVKNDVDVVDGNLTDVSDSFNGVKSNLYGTKTVTIDGETVTVPKDPSDSPSSTSLRGHLDTLKDTTVPAVQNTLYGGSGNSPDNPSSTSLMGKTNAVKADLYGTKTVGGQTVPREPSEASSTSFKTTVTTLRDTTVPAVQGEIFGTDSQGNPLNSTNYSDDSILGKSDELKSDMYGTKTVNGQTVPKDKNDTPDDNSLRGLIKSVDEDINDPTNGLDVRVTGLNGQINNSITGIDAVNDHIDTIQTHMYGGEGHSPTSYTDGSLMGKIHTAEGNIETVQIDIGEVEYDVNSDLQTQIKNVIAIMENLFPTVHEVNNLNECSAEDTTSPRGNRYVVGNYNYDNVFDKSTNKYYQCQYLQSNPPLGYYGEWVQINDPIVDFQSLGLNSMVSAYFAAKTHTHQKSDITDFAHTHSPSDVTGLGTWETVSTSISGVTLYVNQALRLVSFHFYASITFNTSGYTTCGTLPSAYKPLSQVTLPFRQSEQHGYVGNDGVIHIAGTGTKNAGTSAMWCY